MKTVVIALGAILALVGLLGFFNNPVLGIFHVNLLHNLVHLLTGALLIAFAWRGDAGAAMISKVFGVVYAIVALLGFVLPDLMMQWLAVDMADNILHVVLAVIFLFIGFGMRPKAMSATAAM